MSHEDATYYEDRIHSGGIFISVDAEKSGASIETAREILFRNGGHKRQRRAADGPGRFDDERGRLDVLIEHSRNR